MKKGAIQYKDYTKEFERQSAISLVKLKRDYHSAINVNDAKTVHDEYKMGVTYKQKQNICSQLGIYSNFFDDVIAINGRAPKGTPLDETFNKEIEKIEDGKRASVLSGLAYFRALLDFDGYWHEQDELFENENGIFDELIDGDDSKTAFIKGDKKTLREFTNARQVLAVHYLLSELNVWDDAMQTELSNFIQFLTSKETLAKNISGTNIHKKVKSPFPKTELQLEKDLRFIRPYFEKLNLLNIVEKINKEIGSKE